VIVESLLLKTLHEVYFLSQRREDREDKRGQRSHMKSDVKKKFSITVKSIF